mgnify:CR=1 FL=1|tara:strand:- start:81 stop:329 length:249 start_codon:yes stop_codon:yes gene_type:complete
MQFLITKTNDKEWFVTTDLFWNLSKAVETWNGLMLRQKGDLLHLDEVKARLKDDEFNSILFTFIDGFERKWAFELKEITPLT